MVDSWKYYLAKYDYPVQLWKFKNSIQYPQYFQKKIIGNHQSTVEFENYFRENMKDHIEVYYEVVFWKYFSQPQLRQNGTNSVINHIEEHRIEAKSIHQSVENFTKTPSIRALKKVRSLLGIKSNVLAVAMTLISFYDPTSFPMVDNVVANWVNSNYKKYNENTSCKLTPFDKKYTSLQDNDFENYINWKKWCCEVASSLSEKTETMWRARDVEMTVFTFERCGKKTARNTQPLNPV